MTLSAQATAGVLIREATALDAEAMARVQVRSWQAAYRGIIDDDYLDALSVERRRDANLAWFERHPPSSFTRVAVDPQANVIGFAVAGEARGRRLSTLGEVYVIYLLPDAQRRGIGTQMMRSVARGLDLCGMHALIVWSLQRNPARAFYEGLGGRAAQTRETLVGRQRLGEIAYRWDELDPLMAARRR